MAITVKLPNTQETFDKLEASGIEWTIYNENTGIVEIECQSRADAGLLYDICWR